MGGIAAQLLRLRLRDASAPHSFAGCASQRSQRPWLRASTAKPLGAGTGTMTAGQNQCGPGAQNPDTALESLLE
eukprot:8641883-Alexandrium_andersonii.AAC.1